MMEQWCTADVFTTNNKKEEDTPMTTTKKAKLTLDEAMTIINNAPTENKIEFNVCVFDNHIKRKGTYYVIKIDDNNYIVYIPDKAIIDIDLKLICYKLQLNKRDAYNFTVVANSPIALWNIELNIYDYIEDGYYTFLEGFTINIDILYDMIDTPNKIELDDKKARKMLTKARFTGCLYDLFDGGYGYTINNNNVIWYIPDDYYLNDEDINKRSYYMVADTFRDEPISLLDHIDSSQFNGGSNPLDGYFMKNKISINIYAISNKKIFNTDFIVCIRDEDQDQKILAYVHTNIAKDTNCQK